MKKVIDTNILINYPEFILENDCIIPSVVISELENIKTGNKRDEDVKFRARVAVRMLEDNSDKYEIFVVNNEVYDIVSKDFQLPITNDNLIIACAFKTQRDNEPVIFVTNDLICKQMGKVFGLTVESYNDDSKDEDYKGFKEICLSDFEMAELYENPTINKYECLTNQYLVIKNYDEDVVDKLKWNGEQYVSLSYKIINNDFTGKIKPRNLEQELAFDMLQDTESTIKVLAGNYGTGKDFLMISTALQLIKNNKYDKIMWVRNNIEVKNSKPIGFLPSGLKDKLLPFAMIIADHCGGEDGLERLINQRELEIQHLGFIRGRDIKNTIIMCSESENMTKEHIQLLIGRVGEGSALWLNGDYRQVDEKVFETNNGLTIAIDKLKNNKKFGYVKLLKTERSDTSAMADLLD